MTKSKNKIEPTLTNGKGLSIDRYFTTGIDQKSGKDVYSLFDYDYRSSVIRNPSGNAVFEMKNVEVPRSWSQVATDILAQKYFRKAGVPYKDGSTGPENSVKQVVHRMVDCWKKWGKEYNYFNSENDAQIFYDELAYMLLNQSVAPNSPQWFNTGLFEAYGITGPSQGHWFVDHHSGEAKQSTSAYERSQPHACFILSIKDDLVNEGGIMDLWVREARIFKYGSGVGTNYSDIRSENEKLAGGGYSSGLMSFLKIGDRAAGAIKSGGTTRRAAKMVVLDDDHPEILNFINWKVEEEKKVAALIAAGYSSDYEGEAYRTVSGQNSNNSVRLSDAFFQALDKNGDWNTRYRISGEVSSTHKAKEIWDAITHAAWSCADPGVQFHDTINEWHTCPNDGPIRASNPCSEYMFLDNTACNLASINLRKFFNDETLEFDVEGFKHACRLWTIVLEISVLMAQFPSKEIAELSYKFRTLGLGFANLGSILMVAGIPYDSSKANAIAGAISAIMTGTAYATSAEMAKYLGPFPGYANNRDAMLRVIKNHRYAAYNTNEYEGLKIKPKGLDAAETPGYLFKAAGEAWDQAYRIGIDYGYRNAQTTVIAPTGTIGLLMDCDTTGVEPDFALVKFKKLSGGGYFKIINQSIPIALKNLGYPPDQVNSIVKYAIGHNTLVGAPFINHETLRAKGFREADLLKIESTLSTAFDLTFVFNVFSLGEDAMNRLGISPEKYRNPSFNLLTDLGFTQNQIEHANEYVCGTMTVEGAPFLKKEHLPVFDCANKCGVKGTRFIEPLGHVRMMASAQSFISGAISKTINFPNEATQDQIAECYRKAYDVGVKAISIYRDGSKLSQPLSSKKEKEKEKDLSTEDKITFGEKKEIRPVIELSQQQVFEAVKKILDGAGDNDFKANLRKLVNRRELPMKRKGWTQKNKVGGQTIFLRTGEYDDGSLGEIFIDMHKEGATLRSMLNCFAISVSIGLQYGVPLEEFVDKFSFTRFEPSGMVDHPNLKSATSMIDYIFRLLAFEYLDREDLVQVGREAILPEYTARPEKQIHITVPEADIVVKPMLSHTQSTGINGKNTGINGSKEKQSREINGNTHSDGYKNGHEIKEIKKDSPPTNTLIMESSQALLSNLMGDAPACNVCGHITVRSGTCYKCLNCGNSLGCS